MSDKTTNWGSLKVADLRKKLSSLGLLTSGTKAVLVSRLCEHFEEAEATKSGKADEETEKVAEASEPSADVEMSEAAAPAQSEEPAEPEPVQNKTPEPEPVSATEPATATTTTTSTEAEVANKKRERSDEPTNEKEERDVKRTKTEPDSESTKHFVHISNFVRPFTTNQVKLLLEKYGKIESETFWMNAIKSHCYVSYVSGEGAERAVEGLSGLKWPDVAGGKVLEATKCSAEAYARAVSGKEPCGGEKGKAAVSARRVEEVAKKEKEQATAKSEEPVPETKRVNLDSLFRWTTTKPKLYWMPLSEEERLKKKQTSVNNTVNE